METLTLPSFYILAMTTFVKRNQSLSINSINHRRQDSAYDMIVRKSAIAIAGTLFLLDIF